jgi:Rhodopirellula transposase DDE domain
MELTAEIRATLHETQASLSGYSRRHFMAQVVKSMFAGKMSRAERDLGWNRGTLSKALAELDGGFCYIDRYHERGRKKAEAHLPDLLADLRQVVDAESQTDPTFQTTRLYTRLSAAAVRKQLIEQQGYSDDELPCEETIRSKLNALGYHLRAVKKVNR